jgi:hypothetical protein
LIGLKVDVGVVLAGVSDGLWLFGAEAAFSWLIWRD